MISCNGTCKLKTNPTTILAAQRHKNEVNLSYNFTCNPGISSTSVYTSELKIKDLSDGRSISLDYFYTSPNMTLATRGPLVVVDEYPEEMAELVRNSCDLIIKIHTKLHPEVAKVYEDKIAGIESSLAFVSQSYTSGKTILKSLINNRSNLGCAIAELEGDPFHSPSSASSLKRTFSDLYVETYKASNFAPSACMAQDPISVDDFMCQNAQSPLCLTRNIYASARKQLETKDQELVSILNELQGTNLVDRVQKVRSRQEFADLRR